MGDVGTARYGIGDLAERCGLSVRTIRFWSDSGVVPPTGRNPSGHRRYDDAALARLELVVTLRQLGVGLEAIRAVLERRRTVAQVAAVHAEAIEAEMATLRLRRGALLAIAHGGTTIEEMRMVNALARLTAVERQHLVDEFIADTFGDRADVSGIGNRMRELTPALPDDPSPEQVAAWVEVAELVQDPSFRARVRQMATAGRQQSMDPEAGKMFADAVIEHAGAAADAGIDPASPEAGDVIARILPAAGPAKRAQVAQQMATFTDARVDHYWQLLGVINSWPPFVSVIPAFEWLTEALSAHSS